jgi:pimeloyl-ACP methyl ester carboxylesterase
VKSGVTRNGDVQIAYEDFGKPGGCPLLLISGLDGQIIGWPDGFCEALVAAGFLGAAVAATGQRDRSARDLRRQHHPRRVKQLRRVRGPEKPATCCAERCPRDQARVT